MSGVRLSEKHGLNPCIPKCFWCGEDKNEIALLGRLPNDAEAPCSVILDYEPCDKCKEEHAKGILVLVVDHKPFTQGQPPMCKDAERLYVYPSGQYVLLSEEFVMQWIIDEDLLKTTLEHRKMFIDEETFKAFFMNEE
jgi:hypothetical protein